jgi:hypothetical protein
MLETKVTLTELGLLAGTRAMAGFGLGLLIAGKLSDEQRKAIGWSLFLAGAASTIPLAIALFGKREHASAPRPLRALWNAKKRELAGQAAACRG